MRVSKMHVLVLIIMLILLATILSVSASVINYQGKLLQPNGSAVADSTYTMQFFIYDVPTGGAPLWNEINTSVQVKGGLFNVILGSVANIPDSVFNGSDRWFGVKVANDPEMTPRQKVASVPYSVMAQTVSDSSITAAKIAVDAVTPEKIASSAVTTDKVAPGAITADKLAVGVSIPPGGVIMWSGAANVIPQGWALCDGSGNTPDLRDRFIVGAGSGYMVGATGGEASHKLTVAEMPSHNHSLMNGVTGTQQLPSGSYHAVFTAGDDLTGPAGGDQPHENRPPYYALCFIMKLGY